MSIAATAFVAYYELVYRARAHGLEDHMLTLRRLHWERPVLRGAPGEGNAAAEAYEALAGLAPLTDSLRDALSERLYYGQPLTASEHAAIALRQDSLRALRAATRHGWAFTELSVELGDAMRVPNYQRVVDGGLCLLATARTAPPAECLRGAADVIRLGQDLVPGAPLEAASTFARLTSLAAKVVPRCAAEADLATLRRAVHEFQVLATHPPPTGAGIELEDLVTSAKLRSMAALSNKASPGEVIQTLIERPGLLEAWTAFDRPARFRKLTPKEYPDAAVEWRHENDYRARASLPLLAADASDVLDHLHDDMRGHAVLRMLTIGLATLADKAYRGKLPNRPSNLDEPALTDPYRGASFSFRFAENGAELALWSIGEDYKDDAGASSWTDQAPVDIVVRFALNKAQPPRQP